MIKYFLLFLPLIFAGCSEKRIGYVQKIAPPIPAADVVFKEYSFHSDSAAIINLPTGTQIQIEPKSFRRKNGEAVSGQVTVKVREFHTALDLFRAGISMSTDSTRNEFLQTAGMLEVRAFNNEEELELQEGKSVGVELAAFNDPSGYRLYQMKDDKDWITIDSFQTQTNERKLEGMDSISKIENLLDKNDDLVFRIVSDLESAPEMRKFLKRKWRISKQEMNRYVTEGMRVNWDHVDIQVVDKDNFLYNLVFTRKKHFRNEDVMQMMFVKVKPWLNKNGSPEERAAFEADLKERDSILTRINMEKDRLQKQADLVNSFRMNKLGFWNIDRVMDKSEMILASLSFDFEKEIDPAVDKVSIYVVYEQDRSFREYLPGDWDEVYISLVRPMKIIAVLLENRIAIVDDVEIRQQYKRTPKKLMLKSKTVDHLPDLESALALR
jgi:hypothetical protein